MDRLVSIIIPTYNRKNEVLDCLASLYKLNYNNFEVIVIDNGSNDSTSEAIKKYFPSVNLIELKENLGAVGARSLG
ncbi:glycosyltransferase, partial [bacterium]|nr:glycosyltransferase [bacterium]